MNSTNNINYQTDSDLEDIEICIPAIPEKIYDLLKLTLLNEKGTPLLKWLVREGDRITLGRNKIAQYGVQIKEYGSFRAFKRMITGNPFLALEGGCRMRIPVLEGKITMCGNNDGRNQKWDYERKMPIIEGSTDKEKYFVKFRPTKDPNPDEYPLEKRYGCQAMYIDYALGPRDQAWKFVVNNYNLDKYGMDNPKEYKEELAKAYEMFSAKKACVIKPTHPNTGLEEKYPEGLLGFRWEKDVLLEQQNKYNQNGV